VDVQLGKYDDSSDSSIDCEKRLTRTVTTCGRSWLLVLVWNALSGADPRSNVWLRLKSERGPFTLCFGVTDVTRARLEACAQSGGLSVRTGHQAPVRRLIYLSHPSVFFPSTHFFVGLSLFSQPSPATFAAPLYLTPVILFLRRRLFVCLVIHLDYRPPLAPQLPRNGFRIYYSVD
jgi:hypothetical protein